MTSGPALVVIIDEFGQSRASIESRTMTNINRIIGCDTYDHATIYINGMRFNALVDDFGILKDRRIMAMDPCGRVKLYGTIWIEPYSDDRESLDAFEVKSILDAFKNRILMLDDTWRW